MRRSSPSSSTPSFDEAERISALAGAAGGRARPRPQPAEGENDAACRLSAISTAGWSSTSHRGSPPIGSSSGPPQHRRQGRACRHARPAGDRGAAGRARRGDQDRVLCDERAQMLSLLACAGASARDTDDCEGAIVGETGARPGAAAIEAVLPRFIGTIAQRRRSFRRSRSPAAAPMSWRAPACRRTLSARPVEIASLRLIAMPDRDHAEFEAVVGKGTYIRALARDLAAALGTLGHVAALRRLSVGRSPNARRFRWNSRPILGHSSERVPGYLLPIETALDDIPALALTAAEADGLRCGQARDARRCRRAGAARRAGGRQRGRRLAQPGLDRRWRGSRTVVFGRCA